MTNEIPETNHASNGGSRGGINWKRLLVAAGIVIAAVTFSLLVFPQWREKWQIVVLVGAAVVVVVELMANFRQAFEDLPQQPAPQPVVVPQQNITQVHPPAEAGIQALHQLPSPPPDFTGREQELSQLREWAGEGSITIYGMGGVGKTALALVVAHELKEAYPEAQFYIELGGASKQPLEPAAAMRQVLQALHPTAQLPEDEIILKNAYRSELSQRRALVLLDDARDAAHIADLLPPAPGRALVTTRRAFALPGLNRLDLGALPMDRACTLLHEMSPHDFDGPGDPSLAELAGLCSRLPLALRAAGGLLAETRSLTPAKLAADLRERNRRLGPVQAVFDASWEQLGKAGQQVWAALSVFGITAFDTAAAAAVLGLPTPTAEQILEELARRSLLGWDRAARCWRWHDLARDFAADGLSEDPAAEKAAHRRHAEYYLEILRKAEEHYIEGNEGILEGLALFDAESEHITAGQAWAARTADQDETAARLCGNYPVSGAYIIGLRLHPRQQIEWLEAALVAARVLGNRSMEGINLGNLGLAHADLGDARTAIEYHELNLEIARETGDRLGQGNALGNLGNAHADLGDAAKAITYYEQHLEIAREIGDRRGEGTALGNLGLAHADLGDSRKAIEYHELNLEIARETGDRRGQGYVLGNLGNAHADLGDAAKAIAYYEQQLVIFREIGDRRGEGNALGSLGNAHAALGDAPKSIEYYEQALVIFREIGDRRGEGNALGSLGNAHYDLGDAPKAIAYYEQILVIHREIGDRRGEGNALWNTALALDTLDRRAEAVEQARRALVIKEAIEDPYADEVRQALAEWGAGE